MSTNYKQHRLLSENYNRSRPLGLTNPQNLGIVSNRPDTALDASDMEESMRLNMKHMHGGNPQDMDDDDAMMNRHGGGSDEGDDDLNVGDENDLDAAADMDDDVGDDDMGDGDDDEGDEDGDMDGEGDEGDEEGDEDSDMDGEGDEEYPDEETDELGGLEKKSPPMGRPHDAAAYMARHMSEAKKMPPWMKEKDGEDKKGGKNKSDKKSDKKDFGGKKKSEDREDGEDKKGGKKMPPWMKGKEKGKDKKDEGDKKNMKDGNHKNHKKGDCKKCSSGMSMKEAFKDQKTVDRMDRKEFAKKIAEQYWQADDNKRYFSGVIEEDMLLPSKEKIPTPEEAGPGDVGYAPSTRIGEFNGKALAEAVQHLIKKVEKLERKINNMF